MAETTADVRRDIELTRERMTATLAQLEHKLNIQQVVRDNPWSALGVAFGAGLLLSGSRADVKAAAATAVATRGASSRVGSALDDIVANLMRGLGDAVQGHVDTLVDQVKLAIGAPAGNAGRGSAQRSRTLADLDAGAGSGVLRPQRDGAAAGSSDLASRDVASREAASREAASRAGFGLEE